jgi:hypothetical protein
MRLGGGPSLFDAFPTKPKGMHWRTYLHLRERAQAAEAFSYLSLERRFDRMRHAICARRARSAGEALETPDCRHHCGGDRMCAAVDRPCAARALASAVRASASWLSWRASVHGGAPAATFTRTT